MDYDVVNALQRSGKASLVEQLKKGVRKKEKLRGENHQVFKYRSIPGNVMMRRLKKSRVDVIIHQVLSGQDTRHWSSQNRPG